MGRETADARHLTFSTLERLWSGGTPLVLPVQGDPTCRLLVDPKEERITLVTGYETPEPDVARLKNVGFQAVSDGEDDLAELTVRVDGNVHGVYGLLATIMDELQIAKAPLAAAVARAVARHRDVFTPRGGLTAEKEVGLYGELLFLEYLIDAIGPGPAVTSWQGPLSEEHDFVFDSVHVEVKTTSGERRSHMIHGLSQLLPVRDIPLSLLSIQLTRAAPEGGRTLPDIAATLRALAGGHVVSLDQKLEGLGWNADDSDLYQTYWTLRGQPRAYEVKGDFPAMTPTVIETAVPNFALVSDVSYRVDLTDLDHNGLRQLASGFVESKAS